MSYHVVRTQPQHALAHYLTEPCQLVLEEQYDTLVAYLGEVARRMEAGGDALAAASNSDDFWNTGSAWLDSLRPYDVKGGVLTIPVAGSLLGGL